LANDIGESEEWTEVIEALEADETPEDRVGWKERLEAAKERNKQVYKETRLAALALVSTARILFGGNAQEAEVDVPEIVQGVETMRPSDDSALSQPFPPKPFPFLRLPIELQVHVLRCLPLLKPSKTAHLYPSLNSSSAPSEFDPDALSSPLTESQFLRILSHCAARQTLTTERRIVTAQSVGQVPSLNPQRAKPTWADQGEAGGEGWEEWFLRSTGCDRFERAGSLR